MHTVVADFNASTTLNQNNPIKLHINFEYIFSVQVRKPKKINTHDQTAQERGYEYYTVIVLSREPLSNRMHSITNAIQSDA